MREACLGILKRPSGIKCLLVPWLDKSKHLYMWDFKALEHELVSVGFTNMREYEFSDCIDPMFESVEDAQRFKMLW